MNIDHPIIKLFTESDFNNLTSNVIPWTCYANHQNISTDYILSQKGMEARALSPLAEDVKLQIPSEEEPSDHLPQILIISLPDKHHASI